MRYRFFDQGQSADGLNLLSRISWDMDGSWPAADGVFPPEHPSHTCKDQFAALLERGYSLIFSSYDGHSCAIHRLRNQSSETLLRDLAECLGWDRIDS